MKFQKGHKINSGHIPWNKGKKGVQIGTNKGKKFSYKARPNAIGRIPWNKSKKGLQVAWNKDKKTGITPWNKGKKNVYSEMTKKAMHNAKKGKPNYAKRGANSNFWKGGITSLRQKIYHSFKYRQWRSDVFTRDNWTCQDCNQRSGILHPHHIKSFAKILEEYRIKTLEEALNCEELWNINNGCTLCKECHELTDNYKGKGRKIIWPL